MTDDPEECLLIEIRDVYDGWSIKQLPDGRLINRWEPGTIRYEKTQLVIEKMRERQGK